MYLPAPRPITWYVQNVHIHVPKGRQKYSFTGSVQTGAANNERGPWSTHNATTKSICMPYSIHRAVHYKIQAQFHQEMTSILERFGEDYKQVTE